jgi:hypothetical protein
MMQILKRLEIIKSSIAIEDDEIIELQINKLKSTADKAVQEIISLLESRDYFKAIELIESFIKQQTSLSVYIDPELSALKLQLKKLEEELSHKESEKAEAIREIEEFNHAYQKELGSIIEAILEAKMRRYAFMRKNLDDSTDEDELEQQYQEAREEYEEFHRDYENIINDEREELDEESALDLKKSYREAAKLCHPDVVAEKKEEAEAIFKELNSAYEKNDLKKVKTILAKLKNGEAFGIASDAIDNKDLLRDKIETLKETLDAINRELAAIKDDETYQVLQGIDDLDTYLYDIKIELVLELEQLEEEMDEMLDESEQTVEESANNEQPSNQKNKHESTMDTQYNPFHEEDERCEFPF